MCGASFSRGLWGLVAMLANSASQLVLGEQLSSWWDTAPTWNNLGDLWSSSTSCSSGMSSKEIIQYFSYTYLKGSVCLTADCTFFLASFTILHVAPRRGRQVLITLERIERLVHFQDVRFPLFQNKKRATVQLTQHPSSYSDTSSGFGQNQKTKLELKWSYCCHLNQGCAITSCTWSPWGNCCCNFALYINI